MANSATFELVLQLKDQASKGLANAAQQGGFLKNALSFAAGGAILGGITAIGKAAGDMFTDAIDEAKEWNTQIAQLDSVLTSTGGKAGITKDALLELNKSLSAGGGFSAAADDAVLQGQNMLLTFTNIGQNVFPEASKAMLDMATKMNGGVTPSADALQQQAVQLGKALNDPIKGISALSRVGVTFTDEQKDTIKTMMAAGDTMGAQKLILAELATEFGGSATAAMGTFEGQQALVGEQFNNIKQTIGEALMPILSTLMSFLSTTLLPIFQDLAAKVGPIVAGFMEWISAIGELMGGDGANFIDMMENLGGPMRIVGEFIADIVDNFRAFFQAISEGQSPLAALGDLIGGNLSAAGDLLSGVIQWIADEGLPLLISKLGEWGGALINWIVESLPGWMEKAGEFIGSVLQWIGDNVPKLIAKLAEWGGAFVGWILESLPKWLEAAGEFIGAVIGWLVEQIPVLVGELAEWAKAFIDWIVPQIPGLLAKLGEFIGSLLGWIIEKAPEIIGKLLEWGAAFVGWVLPRIPELIGFLFELLGKLGEWIINDALPAIINKLGEWAKAFLDWIGTSVLPFIGGKLGELWDAIVKWISDTARDIWNKVQEIGSAIVNGIKDGITGAWDAFTGWLGDMFQGAVDGIKSFLGISSPSRLMAEQIGVPMVQGIQMGFEGEMPHFTAAAATKMLEAIAGMKLVAQSPEAHEVGAAFGGSVAGGWGGFFPNLRATMIGDIDLLVGEVRRRAEEIQQMMANVQASGSASSAGTGAGNPALLPPWYGGHPIVGGGGGTGIGVLDRGGIVTGPRLAALAMDGRPEAVIPLDRWERMGGGGGGRTINVYIEAPLLATNEQQTADYIARILYDRLGGRV